MQKKKTPTSISRSGGCIESRSYLAREREVDLLEVGRVDRLLRDEDRDDLARDRVEDRLEERDVVARRDDREDTPWGETLLS